MTRRYCVFSAVLLVAGFSAAQTQAGMSTKGAGTRDSAASATQAAPPPQAASVPLAAPVPKAAPAPTSPAASQAPQVQAPLPSAENPVPCVGKVIFVSGDEVVAEIEGGAKAGDRFLLLDDSDRKRGEVKVKLPLDKVLFAIARTGGEAPSIGHRLARPK